VDTLGPAYDDTKGIINKETSIKLSEVYQMLNNYTFPHEAKDDPNL